MFTNKEISALDPYLIKIKELEIYNEPFDSGKQGEVYQGEWHNIEVAVKKIQINSENTLQNCQKEKNILQMLIDAPNIVKFLGYYHTKNNYYILTKLITPTGTITDSQLRGWIEKERGKNLIPQWSVRSKIMYGITTGTAYMHKLNLVHRDLKPENILLDENYEVKICDFGFAKIVDNVPEHIGTSGFIPPETMLNPHTPKSDIYSMGVTFFEVTTLKDAKEIFTHLSQEKEDVSSDQSLLYPENMMFLIRRCLDEVPKNRPTAEEIKNLIPKC